MRSDCDLSNTEQVVVRPLLADKVADIDECVQTARTVFSKRFTLAGRRSEMTIMTAGISTIKDAVSRVA
jgi:hypothetical protein